ncbi:MAG: hypothetical protein WCG80_13525 [Spirochaetales bacterium]
MKVRLAASEELSLPFRWFEPGQLAFTDETRSCFIGVFLVKPWRIACQLDDKLVDN